MRRLRGALGIGVAWGVAWLTAGLALLAVAGLDGADVPFPLFFGLLGFLAGLAFSGVLGFVEGRRRFDEMSLPRFAAWGAVGGAVLAGGFVALVALVAGERLPFEVLVPVFGVAGAASAAGSLMLARMSEDTALLDASEEVGEVGLSEREEKELLGRGD